MTPITSNAATATTAAIITTVLSEVVAVAVENKIFYRTHAVAICIKFMANRTLALFMSLCEL